MKTVLLLILITGSIFAQYTVPEFGKSPSEVWKQLNLDPTQIKITSVPLSPVFISIDTIDLEGNFKADTLTYILDSSQINLLDSPLNHVFYHIDFKDREDSCKSASFTFINDSLYRAVYTFYYRGDFSANFPIVNKKISGYTWGHGSYRPSIRFEKGDSWFNFTPEQVASFVRTEHPYYCNWPLQKGYALSTQMEYYPFEETIFFVVTFDSEKSYGN